MHRELKLHYTNIEPVAKQRLLQFKELRGANNDVLFEELAFCVFAANSSAEMAMKAVELLRPVLHTGDEETYKDAVHGKVRFYNVRSEYLAHNHDVLQRLNNNLHAHLETTKNPRVELRSLFKGIGFKESSHFLRNTGWEGYTILDKHVRNVAHSLGVHSDTAYPDTHRRYVTKEEKIKEYCEENGYDVDIFDLAVWSYKTGKIVK